MHIRVSKYLWGWCIVLTSLLNNSCKKIDHTPNVLVLAHAGMSLFEERTIFPANSFEAIKYSVDVLGSEGVEIDVQMTKDSVLVLFHDSYINTSPHFSGCIGSYNWHVLKTLKVNNSQYYIPRLDTVMNFLVDRNVHVYLDLKPFDFCASQNKPFDVIADQLNLITQNYSVDQKELIIAGSLNIDLLNALNIGNKCVETTDATEAVIIAEEQGYQYLMLPIRVINDSVAEMLKKTPFKWGVFGGKSNGEIRKTIAFEPYCFISDNFVYTQKITK